MLTRDKAKAILGAKGFVLGHKTRATSTNPAAFHAYSEERGDHGLPRYSVAAPTLAALCLKVVGNHHLR